MSKFRKKPVVIEAEQFIEGPGIRLPFYVPNERPSPMRFDAARARYLIDTLEGPHTVSDRDWIIKGIKGEFYACKPDIFAATYEAVEESK